MNAYTSKGDFLSAAILARRVLCGDMNHEEIQMTLRQLVNFLSYLPDGLIFKVDIFIDLTIFERMREPCFEVWSYKLGPQLN